DVHHASIAVLKRHGFRTGRRNGRLEGCPHGTGHGIGLEVHESPRLTARSREVLRAGHVVTIEPGLYYPGIGEVRLEDVVLVTRGKPRVLTQIEKRLEIWTAPGGNRRGWRPDRRASPLTPGAGAPVTSRPPR